MNPQVRDAVLEACGVRERADNTADLMRRLQGQVAEMADEPGTGEAAQIDDEEASSRRRQRGYDVLRTLRGGTNPGEAARGLAGRYGPLADDVIDFAFGDVWNTPGLDRKTRSLEVVAMLSTLGRTGPLASHVSGALNHGATPDELVQTVRMVAVYAGFPAALDAWAVVAKVLGERGIPVPGAPL
jgi:4-carboxymuconolactone decarboxylase